MKNISLVAIDGDEPLAQAYSERFSAHAYPTMLFLSAEQLELYRMAQFVDFNEFEAVVSALGGRTRSFDAALEHLERGDVSNEEWALLAYADWAQLPPSRASIGRRLQWLQSAWERCPKDLRRERSLLAMNLLSLAMTSDGAPGLASSLASVQLQGQALLDSILLDEEAIWASRMFVATWAKSALSWLFGAQRGAAYDEQRRRWLEAVDLLRLHPNAPAEIRLLAMGARLDVHQLDNGDAPVDAKLRADIELAVKEALEQAANEIERQAIISHSAFFLRRAGDIERARAMLEEQAKKSDWPWYYQSTLSAMESQLGNAVKAREWSAKARKSARGTASRIQWIVNDLVLLSKLPAHAAKNEMLEVAAEYYEQATRLEDGFVGRNGSRASEVLEALSAWSADEDFQRLFSRYSSRCATLGSEGSERCASHFRSLPPGP